jgi:hypothetical protein
MANKKKKATPKAKEKTTKKPVVSQERDPREASPKEILFFKIGMSVIGLAILIIAIIFIVRYYMDKKDEDPYQDYVVITVDEMLLLTKDFGNGVYGDPDGLRNDAYEDINTLYQSNENFYIFLYHSSKVNDEITAAVKANTGADHIPTVDLLHDEPDNAYSALFFLDLDNPANASIFENTEFNHLALDAEAENMMLSYVLNENDFELTIDINDILQVISNLQS